VIFRFASPELLTPAHQRYRVRLEGFDPDWQEVDGARGYIAFGNLPPGDFVLRMEALGRDGARSEPTTLALRVHPFWWQTWSARLGGLLLLILIGTLIYRLRMKRLHQLQQDLELRVAERTQVAEQARLQAETALDELRTTQDELVRSAKLSALGQLVAGVAHEVNTPLGVALTASSHFSSAVGQMRGRLQEGRLGRREFEDFLDATEEGSRLIQRNVERAADLVGSFKQVSVDRSSDGRRQFELAQFLDDLTTSLRLLWKHRPLSLQIDCESGVQLDSFPGALGQILTNLVQNALLHAFDHESGGVMRIEVGASGVDRVRIAFSDNGRGMPDEVVARAFEPFFTTRRGSGGTGLGLHIVHNLVRDKLGGTLRLLSRAGEGARFEIELPRSAP
jgi:signal transduction histidine kinase